MKAIIPFLFVSVLCSSFTYAFSLTPMVSEFEVEGSKSSVSFVLQNPSNEDVAIKAQVLARGEDEAGKETRQSTSDFSLFPEQLVLKAGETRNLRVAYMGEKELNQEKAYRLVVEQLPINLKKTVDTKKRVDLKFMISFVASLYVLPKKIEFKAAAQIKNQKLVIENVGNLHFLIKDISEIEISKAAKKWNFDLKQLKEHLGDNLLVGKSKSYSVDLPAGIDDSTVVKVKLRERQ